MEVSGRKENKSGGSTKQSKTFCQPCSNNVQYVEAAGFCQNCEEYLCTTCITYHQKVTLSKNHVVLDKDNMPKSVQQHAPTVCTEICNKHATEVMKFFCTTHEIIGCSDCMVLEHRSCKIDYIPDIAEAYLAGSEFSALLREISRLQSIVKSKSEEILTNEKEADKTYQETVNEIRTFRKEINDYLDRMEDLLLDKCDKMKQENSHTIQITGDNFKAMEKELDSVHAQLTSKTELSTNMFVKARKASSILKKVERQMAAAEQMPKIKVCNLKRSQVINDMVSKCSPLGEVEVRNILQRQVKTKGCIINLIPKREGFVNVKSSSDETDCYISSIVALNDTTLACTDFRNNKVKLVDIKHGTLGSEITVEPNPWDLTLVPNKKLAVTLWTTQTIQFISFRGKPHKGRSIKVNGHCGGITYSKDRFVVSYGNDHKVEILTLKGKVLQCFKIDNTGAEVFIWPLYVAISSDEQFIYVSDNRANSVIKLTLDGQVLATFTDSQLIHPTKLVVCEDNHILVCSSLVSIVQLMSPEGKKQKNILEKKDGLDRCLALCYVEDTNMLFVSGESSDMIQIYKMT